MITLEQVKSIYTTISSSVQQRSDTELQFVVDLTNLNWLNTHQESVEHTINELKENYIKKFCTNFNNLPEGNWNLENILAQVTALANVDPNDSKITQLFDNPRCRSLYVVYAELCGQIAEYYRRMNTSRLEGIKESLSAAINQRGPGEKFAAAKFIREKLLSILLQVSQLEEDNFFLLPEEHQLQVTDNGELQKIYTKIKTLLTAWIHLKHSQSLAAQSSSLHLEDLSQAYNHICYEYLTYIKNMMTSAELNSICLNNNYKDAGAYLDLMPTPYKSVFDYTQAYFYFMKGFNNACEHDLTNIPLLNKIATAIYENKVDILGLMKRWLTNRHENGFNIGFENFKSLLQNSATHSDAPEIIFTHNPTHSDSTANKIEVNFSANSDAMASTNIPSLLNYVSQVNLNGQFLRIGCQTRTVDRDMQVYPSFLRYLQALKENIALNSTLPSTEQETIFLYISNLRTDNNTTTAFEATIEGHRNRALLNAAERTPGFEFVIIPANRGFLEPKERQEYLQIYLLDSFIQELTEIILNNGQDFYLSPSVRQKLFTNSTNEKSVYEEIKSWINETLNDLYIEENMPFKISGTKRQQLAAHFFKYTLTDKLITRLQPLRVATPCKDNIDRGAVHTIYYHIVKMVKELDNKFKNETFSTESKQKEIDALNLKITEILNKDLHCASLLVKGRSVNEDNFGLLVNMLDGFIHGSYHNSSALVERLQFWVTTNKTYKYAFPLTSQVCINGQTHSSLDNKQMRLQKSKSEFDKIKSSERICFNIPEATTVSPIIGHIASAVLTTPDTVHTFKRIIGDCAQTASNGVKSVCRSLYTSITSSTDSTETENPHHQQLTERLQLPSP